MYNSFSLGNSIILFKKNRRVQWRPFFIYIPELHILLNGLKGLNHNFVLLVGMWKVNKRCVDETIYAIKLFTSWLLIHFFIESDWFWVFDLFEQYNKARATDRRNFSHWHIMYYVNKSVARLSILRFVVQVKPHTWSQRSMYETSWFWLVLIVPGGVDCYWLVWFFLCVVSVETFFSLLLSAWDCG